MKHSSILIVTLIAIIVLAGIGAAMAFNKNKINQPLVCTMEAMLCPDGSYVGRTGPKCEFAPCPTPINPATTSTPVASTTPINPTPVKTGTTAKLNQTILNNGVYITPLDLISDSRCPSDVTCIWAGTATLKTKLKAGNKTEEIVLTLREPIKFQNKTITLEDVFPAPSSKTVIESPDYKFSFGVK